MRFLNRRADLFENLHDPNGRQFAFFAQHFGQCAAVEVFHHQVGDLSRLRLTKSEIGDVNDVRVAQSSSRLGFAAKTFDNWLLENCANNFDGNDALGSQVVAYRPRPYVNGPVNLVLPSSD
jgi:hypothetical protein